MNQDTEHLRLLSIFHYILAAFVTLAALFPIIHLVLGIILITAPEKLGQDTNPPPAFVGWLFATLAGFFIALGLTLAILLALTGRNLAKRKHLLFCQIIAGLECLLFPIGTALGVFTLIVLTRDTVKPHFNPHLLTPE